MFVEERRYDVSTFGPLCAKPYSPDNVAAVADTDAPGVDQVYIGNCANGTITDIRQAAQVLAGREVAKGVRCIVAPATQKIYAQAAAEGLLEALVTAGAVIGPPTCGACAGLHMGVLADGQTAVATTNRNYRSRMGASNARIYLANAYVAAASAVTGRLTDPEEVMR